MAILPCNAAEKVASLAKRLNADMAQWMCVSDENGASPFPAPCTVETALARYLDINGAPKRGVVVALAELASDEGEKASLTKLAAKEGREELYAHVIKGKRGILDLLHEFPSVQVRLCVLSSRRRAAAAQAAL